LSLVERVSDLSRSSFYYIHNANRVNPLHARHSPILHDTTSKINAAAITSQNKFHATDAQISICTRYPLIFSRERRAYARRGCVHGAAMGKEEGKRVVEAVVPSPVLGGCPRVARKRKETQERTRGRSEISLYSHPRRRDASVDDEPTSYNATR